MQLNIKRNEKPSETQSEYSYSILILTIFHQKMISNILARTYRSNFSYSRPLNNIRRLNTIAIRREDKSRWERRVALTPNDVSKLVKETGVKIYVQPCNKRIFSNERYENVNVVFKI